MQRKNILQAPLNKAVYKSWYLCPLSNLLSSKYRTLYGISTYQFMNTNFEVHQCLIGEGIKYYNI